MKKTEKKMENGEKKRKKMEKRARRAYRLFFTRLEAFPPRLTGTSVPSLLSSTSSIESPLL
jgi:hypothetical protein